MPRFCSHCKTVGHSTSGCKVLEKFTTARNEVAKNQDNAGNLVGKNLAVEANSGQEGQAAGPSEQLTGMTGVGGGWGWGVAAGQMKSRFISENPDLSCRNLAKWWRISLRTANRRFFLGSSSETRPNLVRNSPRSRRKRAPNSQSPTGLWLCEICLEINLTRLDSTPMRVDLTSKDPDSGNKFKVLARIPEADEEQPQILETSSAVPDTSSAQTRLKPKQQKAQVGGAVCAQQTRHISSQALNVQQEVPKQQNLQLVSVVSSQQTQQKTSGQQSKNVATLGNVVYFKQAQQIASGELKLKIQQNTTQAKPRQDVGKATGNMGRKSTAESSSLPMAPIPDIKKKDRKNSDKGFNKPLKQDRVLSHIRKNKLDIMGILETKLNHQSNRDMFKHKFRNWGIWDNFNQHPNGRIMIIWKTDKVDLQMLDCSEQVIHCLATCKVTDTRFCISFVYAFNTIMGRRPLWANLDKFNETLRDLWLILGDFNNVLKMDEKSNDQLATPYEIRDFQ
ncbi:hypothetical protein Acr_00g0086140 [Actinidia rufa]|uniref:Endonuclease/exonuclease/phosphatase domain-containing protein n=1 Tax=Actinidia rufa TaxID=165716 RepID=A0A7J0DXH6_9ERIC|nr:hypothetical protein Acr_00g0086140 [Actinidia rufa]